MINLVGFKPTSISGNSIIFKVEPANQNTIRPLRNYVLDINTSTSTAKTIFDYQNTAVSI